MSSTVLYNYQASLVSTASTCKDDATACSSESEITVKVSNVNYPVFYFRILKKLFKQVDPQNVTQFFAEVSASVTSTVPTLLKLVLDQRFPQRGEMAEEAIRGAVVWLNSVDAAAYLDVLSTLGRSVSDVNAMDHQGQQGSDSSQGSGPSEASYYFQTNGSSQGSDTLLTTAIVGGQLLSSEAKEEENDTDTLASTSIVGVLFLSFEGEEEENAERPAKKQRLSTDQDSSDAGVGKGRDSDEDGQQN